MSRHLAFDVGGTHTRGGLYDARRTLLAEQVGVGANPVMVGLDACIATITDLSHELLAGHSGEPGTIACGMAGAESSGSGRIIAQALQKALDAERALVTDDMMPLLFANAGTKAAVVVIAGTGSCVRVQLSDDRWLAFGGRGTVFGDDGSGHQLAVAGLRAAADAADGAGADTSLVQALAHAAGVADFADMVGWSNAATKDAIAALARVVTREAERGDAVAEACIRTQAERLARRTGAAFTKLGLPEETPLLLNGGLVEQCERYRRAYEDALVSVLPGATPHLAGLRGHRAVLELALVERLPAEFPVSVAGR